MVKTPLKCSDGERNKATKAPWLWIWNFHSIGKGLNTLNNV